MTETIVSGKMPVLALRGLTVFPDQTVHFDVGRHKSILALDAAMKADQHIFLVPQRDIMDNDPPLEGLYQIGVVAKAKQVLKSQGENLRVLVTGICRGRIKELTQDTPYLEGQIESVPETEVMDSILAYMYCMIEKTRETGIPLTRESLVACGKDIEYHPGVEDWFERINRYADAAGVEVEHYVLSSGLKEIIEGTSRGRKVREDSS